MNRITLAGAPPSFDSQARTLATKEHLVHRSPVRSKTDMARFVRRVWGAAVSAALKIVCWNVGRSCKSVSRSSHAKGLRRRARTTSGKVDPA